MKHHSCVRDLILYVNDSLLRGFTLFNIIESISGVHKLVTCENAFLSFTTKQRGNL